MTTTEAKAIAERVVAGMVADDALTDDECEAFKVLIGGEMKLTEAEAAAVERLRQRARQYAQTKTRVMTGTTSTIETVLVTEVRAKDVLDVLAALDRDVTCEWTWDNGDIGDPFTACYVTSCASAFPDHPDNFCPNCGNRVEVKQ